MPHCSDNRQRSVFDLFYNSVIAFQHCDQLVIIQSDTAFVMITVYDQVYFIARNFMSDRNVPRNFDKLVIEVIEY